MHQYSSKFYSTHAAGSKQSAMEIVPMIVDLLKPQSVIDIGCGIGTWLSVFRELGVETAKGVDGDYVNKGELLIPHEDFTGFDLREWFESSRKYDLAISLEVGEHIEKEHSDTFVDTLTGLSDVVMFSAAIPMQEGKNHVNEQWQEYWAGKFRERGYLTVDFIRPRAWNNHKVEIWYAQNTLLYAKPGILESNDTLKKEYDKNPEPLLSVVHPAFFEMRSDPANYYLTDIVRAMPVILKKMLKRKFG